VACTVFARGGRLSIKGVLVDFGNTLAYVDGEGNRRYEQAILSILKRHGCKLRLDDVDSTLTTLYRKSSKGEMKNIEEFWTMFIKNLNVPKRETLIRHLEEVRKRLLIKAFKLYDGVFPTLLVLRKKYKLALVSNCALGTIDVIEALGLTKFFERVILSYEVGVRKPDRRIYLEALQAIRLDAHECAFVADEISDLEGARAVGLMTILVRQGSNTFCEAKDLGFKPDFQCSRISEITRFL
jgi:HAD superfamily hydrolase (TIGR01509 family)